MSSYNMVNDIINAGFEFGGALAILNHAYVAYKDKAVAGVSILSTMFFSSWGAWNIYYYHSLTQTASWYAGMFLTACNLLWLFLLIKYRKVQNA